MGLIFTVSGIKKIAILVTTFNIERTPSSVDGVLLSSLA
jgi:hypothetical protein